MDIVIDYIYGNCPVQAEGTVDGKPFYFRARGARWSLSIGGELLWAPEWSYEQEYGTDDFSAGYMEQYEALRFIAKGVRLYSKHQSKQVAVEESYATLAALLAEELATKQTKEQTMTYDDIDSLVKQELQDSVRALCDTILQHDLDYDDSVRSLGGVLTALEYYSTHSEFLNFIATLPEAVLDIYDELELYFEDTEEGVTVVTSTDSDLAQNLQDIGFKAVMGMVALGCTTIEELIERASV